MKRHFSWALSGLLVLSAVPTAALAQSDWAPCANEGEACRFKGEALVRFGIDGRYSFRVVRNQVACDTEEFGDPAPNRTKQCQVSLNWRQDIRYRGWREEGRDSAGWLLCASEGERCRVPGPGRVRYGAGGQYAYRDVANTVRCNNEVFGDPAPDVAKQCEYLLGVGAGGTSDPRPPAPGVGLPWTACANENGQCSFRGPGMLRYGANGRYAYREALNGLVCSNDSFGVDPAPGQVKRCEMLRLGR